MGDVLCDSEHSNSGRTSAISSERAYEKHVQVGHIARCSQVCVIEHPAAHQDTLSLRHAHDLPRGCPPIPLRSCPALASAWDGEGRVTLTSERTNVVDFEDRAVLERGADEGVFEVEREAGERKRKRYDVRSQRCGLRVCEACEREGRGGSGGEREEVVRREERRVAVRLTRCYGGNRC